MLTEERIRKIVREEIEAVKKEARETVKEMSFLSPFPPPDWKCGLFPPKRKKRAPGHPPAEV